MNKILLKVLYVIELWVHCYIKGRGRPKKEEERINLQMYRKIVQLIK